MRVPEARGGEQKLTSPTRMVRSEYICAQDRMDSRRRRTSAEAERLTVLFAAGTDKNHVCHLRARMLGRSCRTTTGQNLYIQEQFRLGDANLRGGHQQGHLAWVVNTVTKRKPSAAVNVEGIGIDVSGKDDIAFGWNRMDEDAEDQSSYTEVRTVFGCDDDNVGGFKYTQCELVWNVDLNI